MGMVVRSNIMAMNANRSLGMNNSQVSKNLEKLSSGYRINRAGDDASGLAISEKMKAQIKGLETASSNSQDGISLVQTAEGALTEVHNMLNRMVELAGKAANGTMDNTVDRNALQEEVLSLRDEIDRIAQSTNFNGINLLDGSLGGPATITTTPGTAGGAGTPGTAATAPTAPGGTTSVGGIDVTMGAVTLTNAGTSLTAAQVAENTALITALQTGFTATGNVGANIEFALAGYTLTGHEITGTNGTISIQNGAGDVIATVSVTLSAAGTTATAESAKSTGAYTGGTPGTAAVPGGAGTGAVTTLDFGGKTGSDVVGSTIKVGNTVYEFVAAGGTASGTNTAIAVNTADNAAAIATAAAGVITEAGYTIANAGNTVTITNDTPGADSVLADVTMTGGLSLQVGDTGATYNRVSVSIGDMSTTGLAINTLSVGTQDDARAALELLRGNLATGGTVRGAINVVSDNRAALGALQNRLEYTINNLDVAAENLSAANSRIRDTDMAKQMMEYTKTNVLTQAAQAMLAQANQQPQSILQLLQ